MATIHQGDGETIRCPIFESVSPPVHYDADPATHTARMVIKASAYADDTDPIEGTITGTLEDGYVATFTVPAAVTAVAGRMWLHAWVTPTGGDPMTIAAETLDVVRT